MAATDKTKPLELPEWIRIVEELENASERTQRDD